MRRAAQVGAVLRGTVSSVKPYGLFVRLEGFRANALVHLSQVRRPPARAEHGSAHRTQNLQVEGSLRVPAVGAHAHCAHVMGPCIQQPHHQHGQAGVCLVHRVQQGHETSKRDACTRPASKAGADPKPAGCIGAPPSSPRPCTLLSPGGRLARAQVSEHLDIGRDESDEAKVEALSAVHAVGDALYVKVCCCLAAARAGTSAIYTAAPCTQLAVQGAGPVPRVSGAEQPVGVP
jgi:hypothetical protein